MNEQWFKAAYHFAMVGVAAWEFKNAKTPFRKGLVGGFGGFHLALAIYDLQDEPEEES